MTTRAVGLVRWMRVCLARGRSPGRIVGGTEFVVGPRVRVGRGRTLLAGDRVSIGSELHCMSNLTIGPDVMISSSVALVGDDHRFDDPARTIKDQERRPHANVIIEGDNLIGYGTLIVGSVRIARGAIVGAGSLVTKDLTEAAVYAGRPARRVRGRFE